jgi:AcrR family transcriptional regulator
MSKPVKTQRRAYRSVLRAEQAEQTRRRILDGARRLFIERGYAGTTIAAVAEAAGVVPETVYGSLGTKQALLEGVIEATIAGSEPASLDEQVNARVEGLVTPPERLRAYVDWICGVLARTSPVHAVIRGAADSEHFAAALRQRLLHERVANHARHLALIVRESGFRTGIGVEDAAQRFGALASPEMHHLLRTDMGWSRDRHNSWLRESAETDLLGTST